MCNYGGVMVVGVKKKSIVQSGLMVSAPLDTFTTV